MNYQLLEGDCLTVMAGMEAESVSSIVTDPPYGLSNISEKSLQNRLLGILPKIVFPDLRQVNAGLFEQVEFHSIPLDGSELSRREALAVVESGIGVPKSTVDFNSHIQIGNKEVNTSGVAPGCGVADSILSNGVDFHTDKFLGNYALYLGNSGELAGCDSDSGFLSEFFSSGFTMPVVPLLNPSYPSPLAGLCAVALCNQDIGVSNDPFGQPQGSPPILTSSRAVNTFMLRFDLADGSIKLIATYRAGESLPIEKLFSPKIIGTDAAASGLPPMFKPMRVGLVGFTANGTDSFYFHLWLPEKWIDILDSIIPSGGFMGKKWDALTPEVEVWKEAYRIAKPGAFLLAFGGTRTFHRLTCAIEDAGWEIRDCIMWVYGSGFPHGTNISKSIDSKLGAEREVIGVSSVTGSRKSAFAEIRADSPSGFYGDATVNYTTAPATDAARAFDGYFSNLKPAFEPIIIAMKPIDTTPWIVELTPTLLDEWEAVQHDHE